MYASYSDDNISLEELSIKQNISYQKIEHLIRNYINNSFGICRCYPSNRRTL